MIKLVKVMKHLGITQADIMRNTGLHTSTLSGIVNSRMKPWKGQATRIYDALVLLGYEGTLEELFEEVEG